jgi:hypothetical protein
MGQNSANVITDNQFQRFVSCPLKLFHLSRRDRHRNRFLPFQQRNKLHIRNIIASTWPDTVHTSDSVEKAAAETRAWLKEENITICGAVVQSDGLLTRIPILRKEGKHLIIIQVHGKLRKKRMSDVIRVQGSSRSTLFYLLKAAYRREVLSRVLPESTFSARFFFPDRSFIASQDHLMLQGRRVAEGKGDEAAKSDFKRLFEGVDATDAVEEVARSIPGALSYQAFSGRSVAEVCGELQALQNPEDNPYGVKIHEGCKQCEFRRPSDKEEGCWSCFFFDDKLKFPERHVFELIGHGNVDETEAGHFFQEEIGTKRFAVPGELPGKELPAFTVFHRRLFQLLKTRKSDIPALWLKAGASELHQLEFPLHFVDFEAATYPVPMKKGSGAYHPVYFQFSCHTLRENGSVEHHTWLDEDAGPVYTNLEFVRNLSDVPDILKGTLVQYSLFETRALRGLLKEFRKNREVFNGEIGQVRQLIHGENRQPHRLFDISRVIRDYYFNYYFEGTLGLKDVLSHILSWKRNEEGVESEEVLLYDKKVDMLNLSEGSDIPNPYGAVSENGLSIDEGATAMHAWLSMKNGLLNESERADIPRLLKRYCALDSYAMIVIYRHLTGLLETRPTEQTGDLIVYQK